MPNCTYVFLTLFFSRCFARSSGDIFAVSSRNFFRTESLPKKKAASNELETNMPLRHSLTSSHIGKKNRLRSIMIFLPIKEKTLHFSIQQFLNSKLESESLICYLTGQ